jgi:hypothetical protein
MEEGRKDAVRGEGRENGPKMTISKGIASLIKMHI